VGFLTRFKNKVTGGWADVDVEVSPASPGSPVTVTATVSVKKEPIDIEAINIEIRCRSEHRAADLNLTDADRPQSSYKVVHSGEVNVAGAQQLEAGSSHTFTATFPLDPNVPESTERPQAASFVHDGYLWDARAVVVMEGNDPDSGWTSFSVRA
jgi:hypothetical protein